ncbi:MAG: T9SS type A sorting domain-containing protein, partial [Muribaculaceae bacterium]|nr:T9SS type A sorting domain-containing protein [Muribaculaceae bacterium]
PASDLEINGTYSINSYRLLVYVDDEVYMDIVLEYGTEVEIPDPEVPDTKIFEGWKEEIPETMPACDLEIHGTTSDRQSSVDGVNYGAGTTVTVFDMNGRLLFKDADSAEVMERLSKGLYIINGKKVYVK